MIRANVCHWGKSEWLAIAKSLFSSKKSAIQSRQELTKLLEDTYQSQTVLMNSARAAIQIGLEYAGAKNSEKNEVLIPEYICSSVPDIIHQAGCVVVSVPVDSFLNIDSTVLEEFITGNTRAVIAPHMYSRPADIVKIARICRERKVFLIDDAAQVAGISVESKPLGTYGDMGVLSFAQAKTIVTGVQASGGVLITQDEAINQYVEHKVKPLTPAVARWSNLLHFLLSYYWQGPFKLLDYYRHRILSKIRRNVPDSFYTRCEISSVEARIALCQFDSLERRQQQTAKTLNVYRELLSELKTVKCPQLTEDINYLSRLILQSTKLSPEAVIDFFAKQGVQAKKAYGKGSRPYDGTPSSGLFELPLQNLSNTELQKIISALSLMDKQP